jgi:hypothetical protein
MVPLANTKSPKARGHDGDEAVCAGAVSIPAMVMMIAMSFFRMSQENNNSWSANILNNVRERSLLSVKKN